MAHETLYDIGLKPFSHDRHRGKWASPVDFFLACIGHAFRYDAVIIMPSLLFQDAGCYVLIFYFIIMVVCTIPIVFIQSFLGQFSSTGFISVFRIAPLFKGIGYVSLAINITTLTYYSIFAALPLFYLLHSMRPTLPWSCEGSVHQMCNLTNVDLEEDISERISTPSLDFFLEHMDIPSYPHNLTTVTFSWSLIFCSFIIWIIVWVVLRNSTETIGRIIRYSTVAMLSALVICVIRFGFLPGAFVGLARFFKPLNFRNFLFGITFTPLLALSGLGSGWGSILTMASYNKFNNNITKHTWILCLGQLGLMILGSLSWIFVENFLIGSFALNVEFRQNVRHWMQFMSVPTALSFLEIPHFWSLLYTGMLTLGAITLLIVQLFSVLTSLFDEYEQLRKKRKEVIQITIGLLALGSSLFCSNYGVNGSVLMARYSLATQVLLNLMLLLVVLWIYGRVRFQRDLHFMTNRTYSTCMVYIVRFVAPIVLLYSSVVGVVVAIAGDYTSVIFKIATFTILLPWLLIPGYCIFKIQQTTGLLGRRFRRSVRPTDWYPVDPVDRQRYEEAFGNSEISHRLTTVVDENA